MNPSEVKTYFETLIDDTWDNVSTYLLMQNAQEKLETTRDWVCLRKVDRTQTVTSNNTYLTEYDLPTDFQAIRKVTINGEPVNAIDFDQQEEYKNCNNYYFIDSKNKKLHLTGTYNQNYTIVIFYRSKMGDIDPDNPDATPFPWTGKKALVVAYDMADFHKGGVDGDDRNYQMSPEQRRQQRAMHNALIQEDTTAQLKAMGN